MEFSNEVVKLLGEMQGWLLGAIGAITTLVLCIHGAKFLMGDTSDKSEAIANIKRTLVMGGAIFFLIFLAGEIIKRFEPLG